MKSSARRLLTQSVLYLVLAIGLVASTYGCVLKQKLGAKAAADGARSYSVASFSLTDRAQSHVDTSFSRVLRVIVKRTDGPNWRPHGNDLVHGVYDWSPSANAWVDVPPTLAEAQESLKLRALEAGTPGHHIESLESPSQNVRQVASELLHARTGQDFGFRYDLAPETQKEAIGKWRAWWEKNKVHWTAGKVLEGIDEILKK